MRNSIRFLRKGQLVELADVRPTETLLDYLREGELAMGTKEACREGDCGACTVVLGRLRDGELEYEAVNACIMLLGQVDGTEVVTVEDLVPKDGTLHPVQQALVEKHGSQCGFCTPGFVMSIFALYQQTEGPVSRSEVNDAIAGNLCRCTGYRPIVDAAIAACASPRSDTFRSNTVDTAGALSFLADGEDVHVGDETSFFAAPASIDSLTELYEAHPDATLVAGATDVGLWVTKQMRVLPKVIHVGKVHGFDLIEDTGRELIIGAGATCANAHTWLAGIDFDAGEVMRRFGSRQVRANGTVGGNVANGSPIGDLPPMLIALNAFVHLRKGKEIRHVAIEDYFLDYGRQDRGAGELLTSIMIPHMEEGQFFRCFKITKRFDQDISAVMGAFRFQVSEDGTVTDVRIAYGGMAATPKRAGGAEAALMGSNLRDSGKWSQAFAALREDFTPMDDFRASSRYRTETAHALLGKALIEIAGTDSTRTRIVGQRGATVDG
jgi:xanthine dehydrogenase small subunit